MTKLKNSMICFLILLIISICFAEGLYVKAADMTSEAVNNIWNEPGFQKQFIAGYGINADVEPRLTPEEVLLLEKIRPMMANDLNDAEATLVKQMKPDCSATIDFTLGSINLQKDMMEEALQNYNKAVTKFPSFRRAWRNLGLIYMRQGKYDEAISAFTRMIELGGGDAYSYGLLGFAYASKQDYQAAEAAYRNALLLQPENTEWRLGITRCAFKQQKYADAVTMLEVLINRYPDKADFWLLQAQAYLGMKQPLKAAQDLEALDRMGKAGLDSLYTLGNIYLTENLTDLASKVFIRAIDKDSNQSIDRPIASTEMLIGRGAFPQALKVLRRIKDNWVGQLDQANQRKLLKLEARISMAQGAGSEQTAKILEEIVKIDPLDGESLMLLGQYYYRQNEPDRAMFYYERAESIDVYEVNAKIRHAQVLVGLSRYTEAIPLLRRAQEIKPNDDLVRYIAQVERIAKTH